MIIKKYAQTINIRSGVTCGSTDYLYKCWSDLANLKTENGVAYCNKPTNTNPLIAGRNGTYKQPAPLEFHDWNMGLDPSLVIEKVVLHYKHQTFINNGYYPGFGGATVTLLGTNASSKTGMSVPHTLTEDTITFTGVTVNQLNSSNFGVRFAYPANSETTPGRIELSDFYIEVHTKDEPNIVELKSVFNKNPVTKGETVDITFTAKKTSSPAYNPTVKIDLPFGLTNTTIRSGSGATITNKTSEGITYAHIDWSTSLGTGVNTATLTIRATASESSNKFTYSNPNRIKLCRMSEETLGLLYDNSLTINDPLVTLSSDLYSNKVALSPNTNNKCNVKIVTADPEQTSKTLHIFLRQPGQITNTTAINNLTNVTNVELLTNNHYTITFNDTGNTTLNIPLQIKYADGGEYRAYMYVTRGNDTVHTGNVLDINFIVRSSTLGNLGFSRLQVPERWTDNMADGIRYTFGVMAKYTLSNNQYSITNYNNNLRIGIFNASSSFLANETDFITNTVWSTSIAKSSNKEMTVEFVYDSSNPLYLVYAQSYEGDPVAKYVTFNASTPYIVETDYFADTEGIGLALQPVHALLGGNSYARAAFKPAIPETSAAALSAFADGGIFEQDISPLGIQVKMDYVTNKTVMVKCILFVNEQKQGSRDLTLTKGSGTVSFGNSYDLFGLKPKDLIGKLYKWELRVVASNPYSNDAVIELNNVRALLKYVKRSSCGYGFSIDGEHSKNYGIILNKVTHNNGTNNEISRYKVSGTDQTIINRENIDSKEITLEITLPGCNIKQNYYLIDRIVELFTNDRELRSNKPIPKRLVLDYIPDREFRFVRVHEFDDSDSKGANYHAKIKLEIPDGTTFDIQKTRTGPTGAAPSTIALSPEIYYVSHTAREVLIHEEQLNQSLMIDSNFVKNGSVIIIDTDNRTVLCDGIDITGEVDFNSNWFKIKGEYQFHSVTGTVTSIEYNLRR